MNKDTEQQNNNTTYTVTPETIAIRESTIRTIAQIFIDNQLPIKEGIIITLNTLFNCYLIAAKGDRVEAVKMWLKEVPVMMLKMSALIVRNDKDVNTVDINKHGLH